MEGKNQKKIKIKNDTKYEKLFELAQDDKESVHLKLIKKFKF